MKLIGIDQSTKSTGVSVWLNGELIDYKTIASEKNEKNPIERMKYMYDEIKALLGIEKPDYVLIENVQFQNNFRVYSQLSQLQGVLFSLFFEREVNFNLIEPTAWRKVMGVTGRKRAEQKASVIQRVKEMFGIDVDEDAAEAIGLGYYGVNNIKLLESQEA